MDQARVYLISAKDLYLHANQSEYMKQTSYGFHDANDEIDTVLKSLETLTINCSIVLF